MNKKIKRILLGANIVLLVVVSIVATKSFNAHAATLAVQKMTKVCTSIVDKMQAGLMDLDEAGEYAAKQTSAGNYTPIVRVKQDAGHFLLETSDASFNVGSLTVKADDFYVVNCSKLAVS